jgi:hypothetical protein
VAAALRVAPVPGLAADTGPAMAVAEPAAGRDRRGHGSEDCQRTGVLDESAHTSPAL